MYMCVNTEHIISVLVYNEGLFYQKLRVAEVKMLRMMDGGRGGTESQMSM